MADRCSDIDVRAIARLMVVTIERLLFLSIAAKITILSGAARIDGFLLRLGFVLVREGGDLMNNSSHMYFSPMIRAEAWEP